MKPSGRQANNKTQCNVVAQPALGKILRCTTPILVWEEQPKARGALVADLKIDALIFRLSRHDRPLLFSKETALPTMKQSW